MNRLCPKCGVQLQMKNHEREERVGSFKVVDAGWIPLLVCETCQTVDLTLDELQRFERRAARIVLLDRPDAGGDVYKYARKALGLRQVDLARRSRPARDRLALGERTRRDAARRAACPRRPPRCVGARSRHLRRNGSRRVRGLGQKLTIRAA